MHFFARGRERPIKCRLIEQFALTRCIAHFNKRQQATDVLDRRMSILGNQAHFRVDRRKYGGNIFDFEAVKIHRSTPEILDSEKVPLKGMVLSTAFLMISSYLLRLFLKLRR
jgi:hypothetical protein